MSVHTAKPEHEVAYQDLANLLRKHADKLSSLEMLAVGANMVGKLIALQDQRTVTPELAMKVVAANIEMGNQHLIGALVAKSDGSS
jgi:hypothetical protein